MGDVVFAYYIYLPTPVVLSNSAVAVGIKQGTQVLDA